MNKFVCQKCYGTDRILIMPKFCEKPRKCPYEFDKTNWQLVTEKKYPFPECDTMDCGRCTNDRICDDDDKHKQPSYDAEDFKGDIEILSKQIKNINSRLGDIESSRGKLSKTEFKEIVRMVNNIKKEQTNETN